MKALYNIMLTLVIIGAINWGILGLFEMDLIGSIFGGMTSVISRIIFVLVGLCGIGAIALYRPINEDEELSHS
ncbi:MAG: DUF378 domain-containing protein [Clostridia bacterium]|jgi:uncharacterized membrane protein YuzA (DUF378 family)|nr:DUF378 domain-containing protein [Clostridia bacterium]